MKKVSRYPKYLLTILHFRLTILRFYEKQVKRALYGPGIVHLPKQVLLRRGVFQHPVISRTRERYVRGTDQIVFSVFIFRL